MSTRSMRARFLWLLILAAALGPPGLLAQEPAPSPPEELERDWGYHQGGDVSFGGRIVVERDEVRHGDLTSIGGTVDIDGTVFGEVTVIAGHLEVRGTVRGEVVAIASTAILHDGARIGGNFVNVAGNLRRGQAVVNGDLVDIGLGFAMPGLGWLGGIGSILGYFAVLELLLVFITLLVVSALVPERVRLIAEETPVRWPGALLAGIAGYAALPIVWFLLLVSILGIPLIPLVWCVFFVFKTLALAGIFHLIGSRLGRAMGREMSPLGAVLLGFSPFVAVRLVFGAMGFPVSFLGWLFVWMPLQVVAIGMMILTRGGGRRPVIPAPAAIVPAVASPPGEPAAGP